MSNESLWYNSLEYIFHLLYVRHYNQLLITNRSWILTTHKGIIFWKNSLKNCFWPCTVQQKLERLQFSTSSPFFKIWSACSCEIKGYFWTLWATCFFIWKPLELIRSSSDGYFWIKSQNKKGRKFELRS